jgi:hypothetical protein
VGNESAQYEIGSSLGSFLRGCCVSLMITIVGEKYVCFRRARAKRLCYRSCWSQLTLPWQNGYSSRDLIQFCGMQRMFFLICHASRLCDSFVYFTCSQLVPHLIWEEDPPPPMVVSRSRRPSINNLLRDARNSLKDNMNLRWMLAKSAGNR